jgi:hypothetical protein
VFSTFRHGHAKFAELSFQFLEGEGLVPRFVDMLSEDSNDSSGDDFGHGSASVDG